VSFKTIKYSTAGRLAFISLNRPDKLNAINAEMVAELNAVLDQAEANEAVRTIILSGEGQAFSAGFDLESGDIDPGVDAVRTELQGDFDIIMRFWNSPKVTIAAVHKYCLGSAMEMAVACDLTIAAEGCRFGAPEVRFGSGIVALLLPWFCGPKKAKELLLTGNDKVTAEQAEAWGLVNRVVAAEELMSTAKAMASEISNNDQLAVSMTKKAINQSLEIAGLPEALQAALAIDVLVESTETEESRKFNEILHSEGTRAALAWRQARTVHKGDE
jgi:enoyl-CoA hydratase